MGDRWIIDDCLHHPSLESLNIVWGYGRLFTTGFNCSAKITQIRPKKPSKVPAPSLRRNSEQKIPPSMARLRDRHNFNPRVTITPWERAAPRNLIHPIIPITHPAGLQNPLRRQNNRPSLQAVRGNRIPGCYPTCAHRSCYIVRNYVVSAGRWPGSFDTCECIVAVF